MKLGLENYFCSQECFRKGYAIHKTLHVAQPNPDLALPPEFSGYQFTGDLRPACVTPTRSLPESIVRPDYAKDGIPRSEQAIRGSASIRVYSEKDIEGMRLVCRLGREVLDIAGDMIKPGVTTDEIDAVVHQACIDRGAYPSPLNYRNFPKSVCTSVNEAICHGIPDKRPLQEGDIVNLDVTLYKGGYHGDLNETFFVGKVDEESRKLVQVTYECLEKAIAKVRPGELYRNLGTEITKHARANGFSVVRSYCGHGIGELFHTTPNVPHYSKNKAIGVMRPGHIFTIEPMICVGTWRDRLWPDDWTAVTADGKRSAQFEHTMLVTEDGVEVLTARIRKKKSLGPQFYVPE